RSQELIREISTPSSGSKDLVYFTQYPQPFLVQFKACLWKQHWSYWRNLQYNVIRFAITVLTTAILGVVFFRKGEKIAKLEDLLSNLGTFHYAGLLWGTESECRASSYITKIRYDPAGESYTKTLMVGIFDATNNISNRRNMLMKMAEDYLFGNNMADFELDIWTSKCNTMYEPVNEGSYIKVIDMASGQGGQIQVNNLGGYLPERIVFFLELFDQIAQPEDVKDVDDELEDLKK
ncbi:AAA+ ATPase domain-containing protein, partial [Tanacetum coccineum]